MNNEKIMKDIFRNKTKKFYEYENEIADYMANDVAKDFKEILRAIIGVKVFSKFFKNSSTNIKITKEETTEIGYIIDENLYIFFKKLCKDLKLEEEIDGIQLSSKKIKIIGEEKK